MSATTAPRGMVDLWPGVRRYGPLVALILVTAGLGAAGLSVARPIFIVGCVLVAWDAMRFGAATNFAVCFVMFCLAPFLRRLVDVHAGYEASGLMISGPLLAIMVPAPWLLISLTGGRTVDAALRPFFIVCACGFYGTVLTIIGGDLTQAVSGAVKWLGPPIYGMWLYGKAQHEDRLTETVALVSVVLLPILGLYGFWQYVDPPIWDRFWMTYTVIASIGQPEPFMVRVFSTMNAPAGYATFTAAGLLLFGFRRARLTAVLAAAPSVLGLMLSMYRTAWIGLAVGVVVGLFHPQTWRRAAILLITVPILGAAAIAFTPAGEALQERLRTFGSVTEDSSGLERLSEYSDLLNADGGTLVGHGFGTVDVMQAGSKALDGQFIVSWFTFGLILGIISTVAVIWAGVQGARSAWRTGTLSGMTAAAVLLSLLIQLPLATISSSEIGFLFWSFAAIGAATRSDCARTAQREPSID